MAKQRYLSNAPITEALIDIQVTPRAGLTFADLKDAVDASKFAYYVKSPISEGVFGFTLDLEAQRSETTASSAHVGLRLHSLDEKYVAQCRLAGFTLSRLPPYEDWNKLVNELRRVWAIYAERMAPIRVTRLATRFINNLRLPLQPGESYQKYLNKLVEVPDGAPQAVASFFQRFHLIDVESGAGVNLTLALGTIPSSGVGHAPVILDVDAFSGTDLAPDDPRIWETLDRLRALKNRTFFGSITEPAAELYQ